MNEDELIAGGQEPAQFVINGGFGADTDWTKGAGWTISTGTANSTGAIGTLSQTLVRPLKAGRSYTLSFVYTGFATGLFPRLLTPGLQSPALPESGEATSPYSQTFVASGPFSQIAFFNADGASGTIDNVSLVPA